MCTSLTHPGVEQKCLIALMKEGTHSSVCVSACMIENSVYMCERWGERKEDRRSVSACDVPFAMECRQGSSELTE